MTLFDECREALSADFNIVEGLAQQEALGILNKYPLAKGSVTWSEIRHSDYESFDELSPKLFIFNDEVIIQPLFPTDMFRLGIKK